MSAFGSPETILQYYVYSYRFLDDLRFVRDPIKATDEWNKLYPFEEVNNISELITSVREKFLREGWEGDGEIGLLWLPPFADTGTEDTFGTYIWHVKQQNNGISWLLSPVELHFKRIEAQNPMNEQLKHRGLVPINIVNHEVDAFISLISERKSHLVQQIAFVSQGRDSNLESSLLTDLAAYHQGQLIALLDEFLASCYLSFLNEVLLRGNPSKIKIPKYSVNLAPTAYSMSDSANDDETSHFFTLAGILWDMWESYRFQPFPRKVDMLFKSVNFQLDPNDRQEIFKHIEIRNCIQHHSGQLTPESLRKLGTRQISIRTADITKPIVIKEREKIILTEQEVLGLCNALEIMARDFDKHVDQNLPSRAFVQPDNP